MAACAALVLAPSLAGAQKQPELTLRAYVTTAGPYGERWELTLEADGKVALEIHTRSPQGKMSGEFIPSADRVDAIRIVVASQQFMDLPPKIWPESVPFHRPDLRLKVTLGDRAHEVSVYDPAQFEADPRVQRFFTVWKEVFAMVPLTPKW